MKRDRRSVRDTQKRISVNEYDIERVSKLLDAIGGEEARLMYRLFLHGLSALEQEIFNNKNEAA